MSVNYSVYSNNADQKFGSSITKMGPGRVTINNSSNRAKAGTAIANFNRKNSPSSTFSGNTTTAN